jgi:hypothetical protein
MMIIEEVYTVKQHRQGIDEVPPEPRMHARSKTDNPFPLSKTTSENRACMRGFSNRRALSNQEPFPAGAIASHHHGWKSPRSSFLTLLGAIRYPVSFW